MNVYFIVKKINARSIRRNESWFAKEFLMFQGFQYDHEGKQNAAFSQISRTDFSDSPENILVDCSVSGFVYFDIQHAQSEAKRFEAEIQKIEAYKDWDLEVIDLETFKRLYVEDTIYHQKKREERESKNQFDRH